MSQLSITLPTSQRFHWLDRDTLFGEKEGTKSRWSGPCPGWPLWGPEEIVAKASLGWVAHVISWQDDIANLHLFSRESLCQLCHTREWVKEILTVQFSVLCSKTAQFKTSSQTRNDRIQQLSLSLRSSLDGVHGIGSFHILPAEGQQSRKIVFCPRETKAVPVFTTPMRNSSRSLQRCKTNKMQCPTSSTASSELLFRSHPPLNSQAWLVGSIVFWSSLCTPLFESYDDNFSNYTYYTYSYYTILRKKNQKDNKSQNTNNVIQMATQKCGAKTLVMVSLPIIHCKDQ